MHGNLSLKAETSSSHSQAFYHNCYRLRPWLWDVFSLLMRMIWIWKPRLIMWAYPSVRTAERPFTGDANLDSVKDVAWAEISLKTMMMSTTKPGSWEEEKRLANTLPITPRIERRKLGTACIGTKQSPPITSPWSFISNYLKSQLFCMSLGFSHCRTEPTTHFSLWLSQKIH